MTAAELGALYGAHGWAIAWTEPREGGDAKACSEGWKKARPLPPANLAGEFPHRLEFRNPAVTASGSDLLLVDVDGPVGAARLAALLPGGLPRTVSALSGRDGGQHFYFKPPPNAPKRKIELASDGSVTASDDGYLVAPGAIHPNGREYRFAEGLALGEVEVAELSQEAYDILRAATVKDKSKQPRELAEGKRVPNGRRHEALCSHAGALRNQGFGEEAILEGLWTFYNHCCEHEPAADPDHLARIAHDAAGWAPGETPGAEWWRGKVSADPSVDASTNGASAFTRLDLVAFLSEPPPKHDWLLDGLLEYGELCWLAGRGKTGKSMIALFLTDALLGGTGQFLGRDAGGVDWAVYVDGENREATVRRRVHLSGMTEATAGRIDYRSVRGVDLGSPEGMAELRALVDRPGRGLVVLDSLVALHTADENDAVEVRRFADKLRIVFEPAGVTVLGLAHDNRAGNLRGSLDWRNAADRVLELVKQTDGSRELKVGDVRDGDEDAAPCTFNFVQTVDGMLRRRLHLEPIAGVARVVRSKSEQLAGQVVLLLTGDPTLSRAKVAQELGYSRDHGTFKRAWTQAERILANEGAKMAQASGPLPGQAGPPPYRGGPAGPMALPVPDPDDSGIPSEFGPDVPDPLLLPRAA